VDKAYHQLIIFIISHPYNHTVTMVAKSLLEKFPSDRSDTMSMSPMDMTNSGLRSGASANKNCAKDTLDWKVVTPLALEDLHADSPFFASNPSRALPCFDAREIHIGELLGVGEFGAAYEVTRITDESRMQLKELMQRSMASLSTEESFGLFQDDGHSAGEDQPEGEDMYSALEEAEEKRGTIRERCWKQGKARYAVKGLRSGTEKRKVVHAAVDLAAEKEFLASMRHPNIIRLRGTVGTPGHPGYMLLMDRLHVSMNQKLREWKQDVRGTMDCLGMRVRQKKAYIGLLSERVGAAYDVARALNFLHGHK
jgi:serine/threonine protein kinase